MPEPKILIAEDDEGWRGLLESWLKARKCRLSFSVNGADALPLAEKERPDVIVLDFNLGDTTGLEVCRALKMRSGLKEVPVVLLTTMSEKLLDAARTGGPDHFVVKSESPDELIAVLEAALVRKGWKKDWTL